MPSTDVVVGPGEGDDSAVSTDDSAVDSGTVDPPEMRGVWVTRWTYSDATDVQDIMKQNIQDVLGRGERLDSVMAKSSSLRDASGKYAKDARYLNTRAMLRKYGPWALVLLLIIGCLWWRFRG